MPLRMTCRGAAFGECPVEWSAIADTAGWSALMLLMFYFRYIGHSDKDITFPENLHR